MICAQQIASASHGSKDLGLMELCERLASQVIAPDTDANYRARQAAVWDIMDAGILRARAKNDAALLEGEKS